MRPFWVCKSHLPSHTWPPPPRRRQLRHGVRLVAGTQQTQHVDGFCTGV